MDGTDGVVTSSRAGTGGAVARPGPDGMMCMVRLTIGEPQRRGAARSLILVDRREGLAVDHHVDGRHRRRKQTGTRRPFERHERGAVWRGDLRGGVRVWRWEDGVRVRHRRTVSGVAL